MAGRQPHAGHRQHRRRAAGPHPPREPYGAHQRGGRAAARTSARRRTDETERVRHPRAGGGGQPLRGAYAGVQRGAHDRRVRRHRPAGERERAAAVAAGRRLRRQRLLLGRRRARGADPRVVRHPRRVGVADVPQPGRRELRRGLRGHGGARGSRQPHRICSTADGDFGEIEFGLDNWSARAAVSKRLLGLGLTAGVGYDKFETSADFAVRAPAPPVGAEQVYRFSDVAVDNDRWSAFLDGVVHHPLRLAGGRGWGGCRAPTPSPGFPSTSDFDPGQGHLLRQPRRAAVAVRVPGTDSAVVRAAARRWRETSAPPRTVFRGSAAPRVRLLDTQGATEKSTAGCRWPAPAPSVACPAVRDRTSGAGYRAGRGYREIRRNPLASSEVRPASK